jgi:hypothetical protein
MPPQRNTFRLRRYYISFTASFTTSFIFSIFASMPPQRNSYRLRRYYIPRIRSREGRVSSFVCRGATLSTFSHLFFPPFNFPNTDKT